MKDASEDASDCHGERTCPKHNGEVLETPSAPRQQEGLIAVKMEQPLPLVPLNAIVF